MPRLLLLHGALGDAGTLEPLRAPLAALGAPDAHTLEFEGHGARASGDRPFRLEHFVGNAADWLRACVGPPVEVFGYSMGGYVGLLLAAQHPTRVRSVFTLGTKLVWSPAVAAEAITQLDPARMAEKVPRYAAALGAWHTASGWEAVVRGTAEALPRGSAEVFPDTPHPLERAPLERLARSFVEFSASVA